MLKYSGEAKGKVNVKYVDINTNQEISTGALIEDFVGENYKTIKKSIDGYRLLKVIGNEEGKYIDGTIEVTYVYKNDTGDADIEPIEPPNTDASIVTNENTLYFEDKKKYLK